MLYGAVEAEVILEYQDNAYPGARATPYLRLRFIDSLGASMEVLSTVYAAERLLRQLTSAIDQITLMFREQAIGAPERAYAQLFAVDPAQPPTVLEHFREFGVGLLAPDQYTRQLTQMGLPATPQANGELDLLVLTVKEAKKSSRAESSCMLDLWAAAGLRDALHATLSKALPPLSPSYRPVQVVDGVVASIAI